MQQNHICEKLQKKQEMLHDNTEGFEFELRVQFLTETSEMLADTENEFLQLERDPSNPRIVQSIFRLAQPLGDTLAVA